MPLQNRVTPFGNIVSASWRGLFTGNRGILHTPAKKQLLNNKRWASKAWIYCLCDFRGRKRDVFGRNGPNGGPGWTNLFFFDEASALAAGHRPCFYCQRPRAVAFQAAFSTGRGQGKLLAPEMDSLLHSERLDAQEKRLHPIMTPKLPNGSMVADQGDTFLLWDNQFYQWREEGYRHVSRSMEDLSLLTPPSTVRALASGFQPHLHPSITSR